MIKIALGVSSSISIYKACEIVRGFQKKEASVHVLMTKNAAKMISPLLFSALTGNRVMVDPLDEDHPETIAHVELARDAALLVVAPATANIIGKFAVGIADDFLSTFYMAVRCPVLVAPAMNEAMFLHEQTRDNIRKLKALGVEFVEPGKGYLACKDEGWGRLSSPESIVNAGWALLEKARNLSGKTLLITAGPTREYLDPVRFLSNRSSGKMGYALAAEAGRRGGKVILVSGPSSLDPPPGVEFIGVETAEEMGEAVRTNFDRTHILIMTAAVSDYRFPEISPQKIKKSGSSRSVELVRTDDILGSLPEKSGGQVVIGFAAETEDVVKNALEKLERKNMDLIVANDASSRDSGFGSDFNRVSLVYPGGKEVEVELGTKREISRAVLDAIEGIIEDKDRNAD